MSKTGKKWTGNKSLPKHGQDTWVKLKSWLIVSKRLVRKMEKLESIYLERPCQVFNLPWAKRSQNIIFQKIVNMSLFLSTPCSVGNPLGP